APPDASAHLRYRVVLQTRSRAVHHAARRGPEARPPRHWQATRSLLDSGRRRPRVDSVAPQRRDPELRAAPFHRGRDPRAWLSARLYATCHARAVVPALRAPPALRCEPVPAAGGRRGRI